MSQTIVPALRGGADSTVIRSGVAVSAFQTWAQMGYVANWLQGQGACLVAGFAGDAQKLVKNATYTYHFRALTRAVNVQRVWVVTLRGDAVAASTTVTVSAGAGAAQTYTVPGYRWTTPILYVETVAAKTSARADLTLQVVVSATSSDVWADSIRCFEMPRPSLNYDSTDLGVEMASLASGERIYDTANASYVSVAQVFQTIAQTDPRRIGLLAWAVPVETPLLRTLATGLNLYSLPVPILGRSLDSGQTTSPVLWSVYAKVAGGGSGTVTLSTDGSAVTDTATISSATFAWTTPRSVSVDTEDLSVIDGRRSARWDGVQLVLKGDGTNQTSLAGVCVWDEST